jgi:hypothetical protein
MLQQNIETKKILLLNRLILLRNRLRYFLMFPIKNYATVCMISKL